MLSKLVEVQSVPEETVDTAAQHVKTVLEKKRFACEVHCI